MQLSALEEYGIRCALQLARAYDEGPLPASRMAEKEGLSVEYVSKIMHLFKKAGVVSAERGNQGGFFLARRPEELPLRDLLDSVRASREMSGDFCSHYKGQESNCVHLGECALRPVWSLLGSYFDEVLKTLTLRDLMVREVEAEKVVRALAAEKAKHLRQQIQGVRAEGALSELEEA